MPFLTAPDADVMNISLFSPLKSLAQYERTRVLERNPQYRHRPSGRTQGWSPGLLVT